MNKRRLIRETKGAITVFVAMILVPCVLIAGLGVDLASIYHARSAVRNANQMGANGLLTHYDSVLQELYGLYGVIGDDDDLTEMVDVYVRATLLGEEVTDDQITGFSHLFDDDSIITTATTLDTLSNVDILRRQIEEYAKWRVPVSLLQSLEILSFLGGDGGKKIEANNSAVQSQMKIILQMNATADAFAQVLIEISKIESAYTAMDLAIRSDLNSLVTTTKTLFGQLYTAASGYNKATDGTATGDTVNNLLDDYIAALSVSSSEDEIEESLEDLVDKVDECYGWVERMDADLAGLFSLYGGGTIGSSWSNTRYRYTSTQSVTGLLEVVEKGQVAVELFIQNSFGNLIVACEAANTAKAELEVAVAELRAQLASGECDEDLVENMLAELDDEGGPLALLSGLSQIDFTFYGEQMRRVNLSNLTALKDAIGTIDRYAPVSYQNGFLLPLSYDGMKYDEIALYSLVSVEGFRVGNSRQVDLYEPGDFEDIVENYVNDIREPLIFTPTSLPTALVNGTSFYTLSQLSGTSYSSSLSQEGLVPFDETCKRKLEEFCQEVYGLDVTLN